MRHCWIEGNGEEALIVLGGLVFSGGPGPEGLYRVQYGDLCIDFDSKADAKDAFAQAHRTATPAPAPECPTPLAFHHGPRH